MFILVGIGRTLFIVFIVSFLNIPEYAIEEMGLFQVIMMFLLGFVVMGIPTNEK